MRFGGADGVDKIPDQGTGFVQRIRRVFNTEKIMDIALIDGSQRLCLKTYGRLIALVPLALFGSAQVLGPSPLRLLRPLQPKDEPVCSTGTGCDASFPCRMDSIQVLNLCDARVDLMTKYSFRPIALATCLLLVVSITCARQSPKQQLPSSLVPVVKDDCLEGNVKFRRALQSITDLDQAIAEGCKSGCDLGVVERLRAEPCFSGTVEETRTFFFEKPSALRSWWSRGGRLWLLSVLGVEGLRHTLIIPPDVIEFDDVDQDFFGRVGFGSDVLLQQGAELFP